MGRNIIYYDELAYQVNPLLYVLILKGHYQERLEETKINIVHSGSKAFYSVNKPFTVEF